MLPTQKKEKQKWVLKPKPTQRQTRDTVHSMAEVRRPPVSVLSSSYPSSSFSSKGRTGRELVEDGLFKGGKERIVAGAGHFSRQTLLSEQEGGELCLKDRESKGYSIQPDGRNGGFILCVGKGVQLSLQKEAAAAFMCEMKMHNEAEFGNDFSPTVSPEHDADDGLYAKEIRGMEDEVGEAMNDPLDNAIVTRQEEEEGWGMTHPLAVMGPEEERGREDYRNPNADVERWLRNNVEEMGQNLGVTFAGEEERSMGIFRVLEGKQKIAGRRKCSSWKGERELRNLISYV